MGVSAFSLSDQSFPRNSTVNVEMFQKNVGENDFYLPMSYAQRPEG